MQGCPAAPLKKAKMPTEAKAKKGHWPAGRRRNNPRGWSLLLGRLKKYVDQRASARQTARSLGVSDRTLRRWLDGEHVGGEEHAAQIRELLSTVKW